MSSDFVKELLSLRDRLLEPCDSAVMSRFQIIEKLAGFEIPHFVKKLITLSDHVNDIQGIFSGYELHTLDQLEEIYVSKEKPLSFFGDYSLDLNFNLLNDTIEVFVDDPEKAGAASPTVITNVSRFLPLARHRGDYLVVDLSSQAGDELYELTMGYAANIYAPTLFQHINYLITGLSNGEVRIEDECFDFPVYWYDRGQWL